METLVAVGGIVIGLAIVIAIIASRYKVAKPTEAFILTGRNRKSTVNAEGKAVQDLSGQKVVIGGGTIVLPFLQNLHRISLESQTINVKVLGVPAKDGILLDVDGVAVIKVDGNEEAVRAAAQRFGGSTEHIKTQADDVLGGTLRAIIGTLTVQQIIGDRKSFAEAVVNSVTDVLQGQGLILDTFQIQRVEDREDYLINLGKPQAARVKAQASIAESESLLASKQKQLSVQEEISNSERQLALRQAEIKAETDKAQAVAASAQPLEVAAQQQVILRERELVEAATAKVTERQLEVSVRRPAEAKRYEVEQEAEGKKTSQILAAEAARRAAIEKAEADAEMARLRGQGELSLAKAKAESDKAEAQGRLSLAEAEAEAIRLKGMAEADSIRAQGLAEAEAMQKRAEAFEEYGQAAIADSMMKVLPEIARELAAPMSNIKDMTVISTDGSNKLLNNSVEGFASLGKMVEGATGLSLNDLITNITSGKASKKPGNDVIDGTVV
jgi:flotillin